MYMVSIRKTWNKFLSNKKQQLFNVISSLYAALTYAKKLEKYA